jgi:FixJ family two-component response regulator
MLPNTTGRRTRSHVLVLDDDPRLAEIVSTLLESEGYEVVVRPRVDVLAVPDPDSGCLIVFDEKIAGMDGRAFVERLREAGVDVPAMLFTTWPGVDVRPDIGMVVVQMPFDIDAIIEVVGEVCGHPA